MSAFTCSSARPVMKQRRQRRRGCARHCQASADADHHLLGDADVDQAVGEALLEAVQLGRSDGVVHDGDDAGSASARCSSVATQAFAAILQPGDGGGGSCHQTSSSMAWAYCASFGTPWCQAATFSMKETPLPLTVLAITQRGLVPGAAPRGQEGGGSWPSTRGRPSRRRGIWRRGGRGGGFLGACALLEPVAVDDQGHVRKLAVARDHRGLPVRALLLFAVAGEDESAPGGPVSWPAMAMPVATGSHGRGGRCWFRPPAGSCGSGGRSGATSAACRWAASLPGSSPPHRGPSKRARRVALGHDEAVTVGPVRAVRVIGQDAEIERGQDVHRREIARRVAELRAGTMVKAVRRSRAPLP